MPFPIRAGGFFSRPGFVVNNRQVRTFMRKLSNPHADNVLPLIPLEASVDGGRTAFAAVRGGFLEAQERFFEESIVGTLWFFGVDWMKNLFDLSVRKLPLLRKIKHLDYLRDWDWTARQSATLDLNFSQRYARNYQEAMKILRLKSVRFGMVTLPPVLTVAFLIPWLNQKKTIWLIRHPEFLQKLNPSRWGYRVVPAKPGTMGKHAATAMPANIPVPGKQEPGNSHRSAASMPNQFVKGQSPVTGLKFGLMGGLQHTLLKGVSTIGRWVDQTDYGKVLTVDVGIAGGRSYMEARRNIFGAIEPIVRDIGSLYFYLLCVPHLLTGIHMLTRKMWGVPIQLEPDVAEPLHHKLLSLAAQQSRMYPGVSDLESIRRAVYGTVEGDKLSAYLRKPWDAKLREIPEKRFYDLLAKEIAVYCPNQPQDRFLPWIRQTIQYDSGGRGLDMMDVQAVENLLHTIDGFKRKQPGQVRLPEELCTSLKNIETRENLKSAILQSYRHTVGVSPLVLENIAAQHSNLSIPESEKTALGERLQAMADCDATDVMNSMLRRFLILSKTTAGHENPEIMVLESMSRVLERASRLKLSYADYLRTEPAEALKLLGNTVSPAFVNRLKTAGPVSEISASEMKEAFNTLLERHIHRLVQSHGLQNASKTLSEHYLQEIVSLCRTPDRIFCMAKSNQPFLRQEKINEMLHGGLRQDSAMARQAMAIIGNLPMDYRRFLSPKAETVMTNTIRSYLDDLMKHLEKSSPATTDAARETLEKYFRLCTRTRYTTVLFANVIAGLGLGVFIPKVQYLVTRKITGKNEQPGIAALMQEFGSPNRSVQ